MKASEKKIKGLILEYLERIGVQAWNNPRGQAVLKWGGVIRYGGKPGASDIIGYLPDGRFLAIETKAEDGKNKASKEQREFIDAVNRSNGVGIIAKNLDEVIECLQLLPPGTGGTICR